jgi:hypothetical protein
VSCRGSLGAAPPWDSPGCYPLLVSHARRPCSRDDPSSLRSQYLAGILTILEQTGCPNYPFASTSNGWTTAFHNVYATVALDCHHPVGKNRHHKFKDKMVEIWTAMEAEVLAGRKSAELSPVFALGLRQLERYRAVTRDTEETRKIPRGGTVTSKIGASADGSTVEVQVVPAAAVAAAAAVAEAEADAATPPPLSPDPKAKSTAEARDAATGAGKKLPSSGAPVVAGDAATAVAAAAAAGAATVVTIAAPERVPLPRRNKPRHLRNPPNSSSGAAASTKGPTTREWLGRIESRLHRLEAIAFHAMSTSSGLFSHPSASHLGRLHQLWLQNRGTSATCSTSSSSSSSASSKDEHDHRAKHAKRLQPHYEAAIRQYLVHLGQLVTDWDDADPDDLFAALQDLDALMRAQELGIGVAAGANANRSNTGKGQSNDDGVGLVRDAYKVTLDAYLRRTNPDLAQQQEDEDLSDAEDDDDDDDEEQPQASPGRRPSRKRPADEAMGDNNNDSEGDHEEEEEEEDGEEKEEEEDDAAGPESIVVNV